MLERRAKILSFYKQHSSAREAYKQTMKALDDAKVDAQKKLKIQEEVQQVRYSNFVRFLGPYYSTGSCKKIPACLNTPSSLLPTN